MDKLIKIFIVFASAIFLFNLSSLTVSAQCSPPPTCQTVSDCNRPACQGCSWCTTGTGTYTCLWNSQARTCRVTPSTNNCSAGYNPGSACNAYDDTDQNTCLNAGPFSCTAVNPQGALDFSKLIGITAPNFSGGTVGDIISSLIPYIFVLAGFAMLAYLVFGGFQVMTAGGDPKKIASGRDKILNAIVGFIIVFTSYFIIQIVGQVLNIQTIQDIFG